MIEDTFWSPDGRWLAKSFFKTKNGGQVIIFEVIDLRTNETWIVEEVPYQFEFLMGYDYLVPRHWSADGQTLIVGHRTTGGDGCYTPYLSNSRDLISLDLENHTSQVLLQDFRMTSMAISPNGQYLTYLHYEEDIVLRHLVSGQETRLPPLYTRENTGLGVDQYNVVWSPDSRSFVYQASIGPCDPMFTSYSIIKVDLSTGAQTILLNRTEEWYQILEWKDAGSLTLRDVEDRKWELSLANGVLTQKQ